MSYDHHRNPTEIKNLFGSISNTYDLANDVITFGMAQNWSLTVPWMQPPFLLFSLLSLT